MKRTDQTVSRAPRFERRRRLRVRRRVDEPRDVVEEGGGKAPPAEAWETSYHVAQGVVREDVRYVLVLPRGGIERGLGADATN